MDNQKKKICFVVAADITLKFLLLSEMKFFKNQGYEVFAVSSPGKWLKDIEAEGMAVKIISIKRKAFTPFSDSISLCQLLLYFKKEKFDAVLTFTPKPGLLGQLAAKAAGVPVIVNTIFGFYFHEHTPYFKKRFFVAVEKIAAGCSSRILFRNQEDFDTAKKEHIGTDALNTFIGDGIDIDKFNPARFSQTFIEEKKAALGIPEKAVVIGIVARLVKEKGYRELFEAFQSVLARFPDTLLLVIGPADVQKKDSLHPDAVKNFDIENKVIFLGERTDVDQLYSLMDLFVLPSRREGFSHSVMEACAMARPVIASDIRGCRGAIDNGRTGILVPPKNWQALAQAMISCLENPVEAQNMGQSARQKAEREFDQRLVFKKTEQALQNV